MLGSGPVWRLLGGAFVAPRRRLPRPALRSPPPYSSPAHAHPNPRDPLFAVLCARGAQAVVVGGAPNSGQWGPRVVTTVGGKGGASVQLVAECCVRCCPFGALRRGLEGGVLAHGGSISMNLQWAWSQIARGCSADKAACFAGGVCDGTHPGSLCVCSLCGCGCGMCQLAY